VPCAHRATDSRQRRRPVAERNRHACAHHAGEGRARYLRPEPDPWEDVEVVGLVASHGHFALVVKHMVKRGAAGEDCAAGAPPPPTPAPPHRRPSHERHKRSATRAEPSSPTEIRIGTYTCSYGVDRHRVTSQGLRRAVAKGSCGIRSAPVTACAAFARRRRRTRAEIELLHRCGKRALPLPS
jgi:hypothetical protein